MPKVETSRGIFWVADQRHNKEHTASIVIHGAGGSHLSFPKELRKSKIANPIFIDLNGHGLSKGQGHTSISNYADDIISIMDALTIDRAILIGHSMGGAISQWIALDYPERVIGLVLIGASAKFAVNAQILNGIVGHPDETIALLNKWMWSKSVPDIFREKSAEMMQQLDPQIIQKDYIAANEFDVSHRLHEIHVPTLVVAGEQDKMADPDLSQQLANGIPNAKLEIISGAGHMMHLEQPEAVTQLIENWLTSLI